MWTHPAATSVPRGVSGCLKESVWGLSLEFPGEEWMSFEEAGSSNELEYCLLGGRSLWVGHQIKGGPTLLLTASVQVCNWTEQRAETLTLKKRLAGTVLSYLLLQSKSLHRTNSFCQQMICDRLYSRAKCFFYNIPSSKA